MNRFFLRKYNDILWFFGVSPRLTNNKIRGWYGEWLALRYLKKRSNFSILEKNWQSQRDARREIDIVGLEKEILVFVEVRARSANSLLSGYQSINRKKRNSIRLACKDFLYLYPKKFQNYRFDVIEVDLAERKSNLFHHQNVSLFSP